MVKNLYIFFSIIIGGVIIISGCGGNHLMKGHTAYDQLKYHEAIKDYEKVLKKSDDYKAKVNLADSYRLTNQFEKAEQWYAKVVNAVNANPELKYYYAQMLLANGKSEDALHWAREFNRNEPKDSRGISLLESIENQNKLIEGKDAFIVKKVSFNSDASDFSPMFFQNELIFISDRKGKTNPWTGRAYTSIYQVNLTNNETTTLKGNFSGNYNDGPVSFTNNGNVMYFSRNNKKKKKGKDDVIAVSIFSAKLNSNSWELSESFPLNSTEFSNMHPAISPDGKFMVFTSDRPGGSGRKDLYISFYNGASWSLPKNLGAPINTPGNEAFPYFANDGKLYFASDGMSGFGGLDLYSTELKGKFWTSPENLGTPINSTKDDFGLITKNQMNSGYFSTNRNSSDGTDDIFHFTQVLEGRLLNGIVVDEETGIPLPDVEVTLINQKTGLKEKTRSKEDGRFQFSLEPISSYRLSGIKNKISTNIEEVSTANVTSKEPLFAKLFHNDPRFTLNGKAINKNNNWGIEGVEVKLFNLRASIVETAITDSDGNFNFQLEQNTDYQISGLKDGYFTSVQEATTKGLNRSTNLYVKLVLTIEEVILGKNIKLDNTTFAGENFNDILYDFNEYNIRSDAALELNKLIRILNRNPSLIIELSSHTDSRGDNNYNKKLSNKRAESAMNYIISNRINSSRISAKGFGEAKLLNHCQDSVNCSEEEHQTNRRTEIRIVNY